ncbi:MAG: ATP-binding cassette domain-containing protein [Gammaproteobacteria bacterium]|nr:MAG: ATP-binding cassette domain-containing protein [Gammaproteobacteria bacterium]
MEREVVVDMQGISTHFGDLVVHKHIDLKLHRGERLGLLGGSGSGKTVLMREMIRLHRPSSGHVTVLGERLDDIGAAELQQLRNRCGVLFQQGALFSDLDVFENVALPLRELGHLPEPLIADLVWMKIELVGLDLKVGNLRPSELSGGMLKRAGLARALALEPELLFLDEPTSGLDPVSSERFVDLLQALHRDLGFSMVMITHDLHTLRDLCDTVAVLAEGELVAHGTLAEVRRNDHPFVQDMLGGRRASRVLGSGTETDG